MSERIIGTFFAQAWQRDQAIELWNDTFDATALLLGWDATALQQIEDRDYSSDEIGQAFFDHAGPHEVEIETGLCEFFGVDHVAEITQPMVNAKRRQHAMELAQPVPMRLHLTLDVAYVDSNAESRTSQYREALVERIRGALTELDGLRCEKLEAGRPVRTTTKQAASNLSM